MAVADQSLMSEKDNKKLLRIQNQDSLSSGDGSKRTNKRSKIIERYMDFLA